MEAKLFTILVVVLWLTLASAREWPFCSSFQSIPWHRSWKANIKNSRFEVHPHDGFLHWLHDVAAKGNHKKILQSFTDGLVPRNVPPDSIIHHLAMPTRSIPSNEVADQAVPLGKPTQNATKLFSHLPYALDSQCVSTAASW